MFINKKLMSSDKKSNKKAFNNAKTGFPGHQAVYPLNSEKKHPRDFMRIQLESMLLRIISFCVK